MLRNLRRAAFFAIIAAANLVGIGAWAVNPTPLQNAYWRFEEGADGAPVAPVNQDVVLDSTNSNHMRTANAGTAPTYTSAIPPLPLQSGLPNNRAMNFGFAQDIFAHLQPIDNGYILPGGGYTVEAAFMTGNPGKWGTVIAKEGRPGEGNPNFFVDKVATFSMKTREDNSHLMVETFDAAGNHKIVQSGAPILANTWYYAAVVNDGAELSLWLNSGEGYVLQGSVNVDGALYQGPPILSDFNGDLKVNAADYVAWRKNDEFNVDAYNGWRAEFDKNKYDWFRNWVIGRGQFEGFAIDWFDGLIDEVRLSNTALSPSEFLFAPTGGSGSLGGGSVPEPASMVLFLFGMTMLGFGSRRNSR
jgi:hypothetical protein